MIDTAGLNFHELSEVAFDTISQGWQQEILVEPKDESADTETLTGNCNYCIMGAYIKAYNVIYDAHITYTDYLENRTTQYEQYVAKHLGFNRPFLLCQWNDSPERTVDDVLNLISSIIKGNN